MGLPGLIGSQVPDGPDAVWVTLKAIQAQAQQVQAQIGSAQALITLATQQIAIQNQQIALNNAQIALAANQLSPDVGNSSGTGTWSTSYSTFCSFSFTVPSGYTRALISATGGSATFTNNAGGDDYRMRVVINGAAGGESRGLQTDFSYLSATSSANIGGLTGGVTIPVSLQARLSTGPGGTGGTSVITAIVVYLK
jgi:hypothetical protein